MIVLNEIDVITSGLSEILKKCIKNGASLIMIPSNKINIENYNQFLNIFSIDNFNGRYKSKTSVNSISIEHPLFKNVFEGKIKNINYPEIKFHYLKEKFHHP